MAPATILWVSADDRVLPFVRAVANVEIVMARGVEAALAYGGPVDLALVDFRQPDGDGVALLRALASARPSAERALLAAYDELPAVVAAGMTRAMASCILPRGRWSVAFQQMILKALRVPLPPPPEPPGREIDWAEVHELLQQTVHEATQVPGAIIRPLPADPRALTMQIVLPTGAAFEYFRCRQPERWGWPTANLAHKWPWQSDADPGVGDLGPLLRGQEIYVRALDHDPAWVFLAVLPWRDDSYVTLMLGLWTETPMPALRQVVASLHAFAVEHAPAFFLYLPDVRRHEASPTLDYLREYDWVVTDSYVGFDRRQRETPLFNPHLLWGNRRRVPEVLANQPLFVDRLSRFATWCLVAYLVFSLADTVLTFVFVRRGWMREMNPLLRQLVYRRPILFLLVKNILSIGAFIVMSRFQLFRVAKYLMPANVIVFAALVAYWLTLLVPLVSRR